MRRAALTLLAALALGTWARHGARPGLPQDHPRRHRGRGDVPGAAPRSASRAKLQAQDERAYIQQLIDKCKSKDEVKRALVAEYGENVLALPGDQGDDDLGDVLVYVIPAPASRSRRRDRVRRSSAGAGRRSRAVARRRRRRPPRRRHGALRPVIAQDSVDATVFAAFAVGFISFISPCVLPLVPGYLSTISGVSFADIQEGKGRSRVLGPAILFCLAFTAMFVALGMTATGLGQTLQDNRAVLRQISGRRDRAARRASSSRRCSCRS